jgi:hypothetical protein
VFEPVFALFPSERCTFGIKKKPLTKPVIPLYCVLSYSVYRTLFHREKSMDEKRKKKENGDESPGYEDLLNGFAFERKTDGEPADLDSLALAELLGENGELKVPETETKSGMLDSIAGDEYSDFARQFEELDLGALSETGGSVEDKSPREEEVIGESSSFDGSLEIGEEEIAKEGSMGYASLLNQMETVAEEREPPSDGEGEMRFEDLGFEEMPESGLPISSGGENILSVVDTAEELPSLDEELPAVEPVDVASIGIAPESGAEGGYSSALTDLIHESGGEHDGEAPVDSTVEEGKQEEGEALSVESLFDAGEEKTVEEPVFSIAEEPSSTLSAGSQEPEHDFLGLSGVTETVSGQPKKPATKTEVNFEGVEMNYDEQIADVTLAELLFAQGKKKEAADLFLEVSKRKGVTHWVAKRLRLLSSNQ